MNETIPSYTVGFENTQTTTAYIPTVFIVPPELKVGDNWYVKLPGWNYVFKSEILEVTEKTVKIKFGNHPPPQRYKKSDVEFVEKV